MKKNLRIVSVMLIISIVVCAFSACGKETESNAEGSEMSSAVFGDLL